MKLSWLFNGTMEAHHLAAAYCAVWLIQGGYATWIALQFRRVPPETHSTPPPAEAPQRTL